MRKSISAFPLTLAVGFCATAAFPQDREPLLQCEEGPAPTVIEYGQSVGCSIDPLGDSDLFRFHGAKGDLVRIVLSLRDNFSATPQFELMDSEGVPVAPPVLGGNQSLTIELGSSDVFTILVRENDGDHLFTYILTVYRIFPRAPESLFICNGCVVPSGIDPVSDLDSFTFRVANGDFIEVSLSLTSTGPFPPSPTPQFELYRPNRTRVTSGLGTGQTVRLRIEEEGEHTILVHENDYDQIFGYNIGVQCLGGPCLGEPANCQLSLPASDLAFSGARVVQQGSLAVFGYTVLNHGAAPAPEVILTNTFPPGVSLEELSPPGCEVAGRTATCGLGDLEARQRVEFSASLRFQPELGGDLVNEARLSLREGACDPNLQNNRLLLTQLVGTPPELSEEFIFPQVVNGRNESLEFRTAIILSNHGEDTRVEVDFRSTPDGNPMEVIIPGFGQGSTFSFSLRRGESAALESEGGGPPRAGYVRVRSGGGISGAAVFSRTDLTFGLPLFETGVPVAQPLTDFHILVDSRGDRDTGLALVYAPDAASPAGTEANVTLRLYDQTYQLIGEARLEPLAEGSHVAQFVHEFFDSAEVRQTAMEMQGILTVESDRPVAAVTLRQTDAPGREYPEEVPFLTTFPVIAGRPER